MADLISQESIMNALDWAYEKAVNGGIPGTDSAEELAKSYMDNNDSPYEQANSLIRWQNTKAGASGFITGLGGIVIPVAIPANIASVLFVQLRMIAAIAYIGGCDIKDDKVKTLMFATLVASSAQDVVKGMGISIGTKLTMNAIKSISGATLTKINQMVGVRLLTKFGTTGVVNLGKAIPLVGGLIGGAVDAWTTDTVGNVARDTFTPKE